jgi:hypothetical protein
MITTPLFLEFENLRHKWGWFLLLGIVMLVLGTVASIIAPAATIGTVMVLGWLIVVSVSQGSDSFICCQQILPVVDHGGRLVFGCAYVTRTFGVPPIVHPHRNISCRLRSARGSVRAD